MSTFGSNAGFVDEMYAEYRRNPESVSESWREFFADYEPSPGAAVHEAPPEETPNVFARPQPAEAPAAMPAPPTPVPANNGATAAEAVPEAQTLRGIAGKIAENMDASLAVPTATSSRTVPVKLLEENRRLLNQHQAVMAAPKISYTHLIAWAIVEALEEHPEMRVSYRRIENKPHRLPHDAINLGVAVDLEKRGERILLVPNLKDVGAYDFPSFVAAYNELITRARNNQLKVEDFEGTTVSLTNPGTLGTHMSVPRLMPGQGVIVGTGAVGYPAEFKGVAPSTISELGLSKTMNLTSTYDHRVIQGAASGRFLRTVEQLLLGESRFYERIFRQLDVPYEPVEWRSDYAPGVAGHNGNLELIHKQASVLQLIRAHRVRGHLWADLDPLSYQTQANPELELSTYNLTVWDLDREFVAGELAGHTRTASLREILDILRQTYCEHIGVEFMHIPESAPRTWLQTRMESTRNSEPLGPETQARMLHLLNAAEAFETFLHRTYVGQKRFSLEGSETLIPMLAFLFDDAAQAGVEEVMLGMAHRGRLNVLANILNKPIGRIFREFEGDIDPTLAHGSGDVKYHVGASGEHVNPQGQRLQVNLASNPSHLEAVDPVVEGMARARQDQLGDKERRRVLPVLVHGDAAFSGQGVVAETFSLSRLPGYRTGGTVHIVVNNQIGFTAGPEELRSSPYATDFAKAIRAPIFHVNGNYPEDAVRVIRHALAFRQEFGVDAVVDLVCYRRWGHNEGDEPSYTHPVLYQKIKKQRSVRKIYTERLLRRGDLNPDAAERALDDFRDKLREVHEEVRKAQLEPPVVETDREAVEGVAAEHAHETAISQEMVNTLLDRVYQSPEGFGPHPKLERQLRQRTDSFRKGSVEWGLAEAMAFGSLLLEGHHIRLSGEDSQRGTFSQRHAVLHDQTTGAEYTPLKNLTDKQGKFSVFDSLLSEFAVLGFEYGYSVSRPECMVLWEAQFGDFANGAQVILDQFISCARDKWGQTSRIVMLLPHGFEGQGPEHSSARIERYLQLCAEGNWQVSYPSTPAQYFHLLRRQMHLPEPGKPLVVFTPKSLLRLPAAASKPEDFTDGCFREVLPDVDGPDPAQVERLLLCSGKVYYDLAAARKKHAANTVGIARIEQFYPFPARQLQRLFKHYTKLKKCVWVQEEPRNMGARDFLDELLVEVLSDTPFDMVCRPASASPATGSHVRHVAEQEDLMQRALFGEDAS